MEPIEAVSPATTNMGTSLLRRLPFLRALGQKPDQVVVRSPGDRFLSAPSPIEDYAPQHWEYAWLSVAAYRNTPRGQQDIERHRKRLPTLRNIECQGYLSQALDDPASVLKAAGWTAWDRFPGTELQKRFDETHLRVEVWQKHDRSDDGAGSRLRIAVAFGGTVFKNKMDWLANLRWFLPKWLTGGRLDEYSAVVQEWVPAFIDAFKRRVPKEHAPTAELVATGHSLGGGLAQQFAYALAADNEVPRVSQVFAFDPSPVTGFYSVKKTVRDENIKKLATDRIYERGEILALLRSLTSLFVKPSAEQPTIRGVRYALFYSWNPIASHSILQLASKLRVSVSPRGRAGSLG